MMPGGIDEMRDDSVVGSSDGTVLDLILVVLEAFRQQRISYCYWKSARRVQEVLSGNADLDLLIGRSDRHRAQQVLLDRGLKHFPTVAVRNHPAISSYLGYDEPSGLIVHLHLHFRLVLGERLAKNYQVPWEAPLLADAQPHPTIPLRILDPATEAVLLVTRACLELSWFDPATVRGRSATTAKFQRDRHSLAAQIDRPVLRRRAAELLGEDIADETVQAVFGDPPLQKQRHFRRLVRRRMAVYRTYNTVEARLRSLGRSVCWLAGGINARFAHRPRPWSRLVPGGGSVIAVVGVDGSGKSTAVACVREWLGSEMDVVPIYFGTGGGRPTLLLLPLKLLVPIVTRLFASKPRGSSHGAVSDRRPGIIYSGLLAVWATVLAVEKRLKLSAARRGADRGLVVIADRYPQDEIVDFNDGPLLPRLAHVPAWLRRFEASAYALARRLPPDLVLMLQASPETIAQREPGMAPAVVQQRTTALNGLTFQGAKLVRIDAGQPLAEVTRAVKRAIWQAL
jgi:thymidylate kinase